MTDDEIEEKLTRGEIRVSPRVAMKHRSAAERASSFQEVSAGYTEEEAVGQWLGLIIPEPQREAHWKGYGKAMLDGYSKYGSETLSVPAVTKDGDQISIEFTINLLRDGDGKVRGPVAVVRDVTARWNREKALRQRLAFLEAGQTAA